MPVGFLTAEQRRRYGRFGGEPTPAQLGRYFHLDRNDIEFVETRRRVHNRLGVATQLVTVRFLGTFLSDPADVPAGCAPPRRRAAGGRGRGGRRRRSGTRAPAHRDAEVRWDHQAQIRVRYGYRDFAEAGVQLGLLRWLYARAWVVAERACCSTWPPPGLSGPRCCCRAPPCSHAGAGRDELWSRLARMLDDDDH